MNKNYDINEVFDEIVEVFDKEDILILSKKIDDYIRKVYKL